MLLTPLGDISFLKNGAILDLGTINLNIANYYNVTSKVMIKNNITIVLQKY